jgi:hypothetical protein
LFIEVGINQEQKKGSVEELHYEDSVSDDTRLLRKGIVANADNQKDDDLSQNKVDTDNDKLSIVKLGGI